MSLPKGYKRLEYIQSSGTQFIDSLFAPNQNTRLVMDFEVMTADGSGWRSVFGSRESSSSGHFALFLAGKNSPSYTNQFYSDIGNTTHWFGSSVSATGRHTVDCNKNTVSIDGNAYTHTAIAFQNSKSIYLCANNEAGTTNMGCDERIYSCQIYDNETLARDYIPCQNTDGEIGLWDDANAVFYGNAGTGAFTAGPEIIPNPPTAPTAFENVLAVYLRWAAVENATGYRVYRDGALIADTEDTFFADLTAEWNQTYIYTLTAYNEGGESAGVDLEVMTKAGYYILKPVVTSATFQ